jgi:hypothetical protein
VSDEHWKEWVEYWLNRASLVIVDASVRTTSIEWEIEAVHRAQKSDRLLVIATDASEADPHLPTITYGSTPETLRRFREALAAEAAAILQGSKSAAKKSPARLWLAILLLCFAVHVLSAFPQVLNFLAASEHEDFAVVVTPFIIIFLVGLGVCLFVSRRRR